MNKLQSLIAIFALTITGFGMQACTNKDSDAENAAEQVTDGVGDAAHDAGDAVSDAAEDITE